MPERVPPDMGHWASFGTRMSASISSTIWSAVTDDQLPLKAAVLRVLQSSPGNSKGPSLG